MAIFLRFTVILVVLALAGEFLVRAVITLPVNTNSDRVLGWMYRPYSSVFYSSEGWAVNRMNGMGFNEDDPDINNEKTTVVVLGDSITEALQVSRPENFTSIAENMAPCLNIYNAARSGLSPVHYPTVLSRVTSTIEPALAVVVVTFGDMSDIRNGDYAVVRGESDEITGLTVRGKRQNRLRILLDPLLSRSALATYLMQRTKALAASRRMDAAGRGKVKTGNEPDDAGRIHELLSYLFVSMNERYPVGIVYIPKTDYGVDRTASTDSQSDRFEEIVRSAAVEAGVPMSSAGSYLKHSYRQHGQPGMGFPNKNILNGHLNILGHQAVALALHELVSEAGLQCRDQERYTGTAERQ